MEWVVLVVVVLVVLGWWLGRGSSDSTNASAPGTPRSTPGGRRPIAPGSLTRAAAVGAGASAGGVLRGAPEQDDPDGAFIDGYVVGRLTERVARSPAAEPTGPRDRSWLDDDVWCGSDDTVDEEYLGGESSAEPDDAFDDEMSDDW